MPDGTLLPLPIPEKLSAIRYTDIVLHGHRLGRVVQDLTGGRQRAEFGAHLDPDIVPSAYPRMTDWRGLFGQTDVAQRVLERERVGGGDLFLFFGWFREVEERAGVFQFVKGAPDLHLLWGWLQVERVLAAETDQIPAWAAYHPHTGYRGRYNFNTLYVARERLSIAGIQFELPGAGVFSRYDQKLQLTKPGSNRSLWNLPAWFAPVDGRSPLGFHGRPARWCVHGDRVDLQSVARGQEFVLDTSKYSECVGWVSDLLSVAIERGKQS